MALIHQQVFERYVHAGAVTRNPDAIAALFTEDGAYEAPLAPGVDLRLRLGIAGNHLPAAPGR